MPSRFIDAGNFPFAVFAFEVHIGIESPGFSVFVYDTELDNGFGFMDHGIISSCFYISTVFLDSVNPCVDSSDRVFQGHIFRADLLDSIEIFFGYSVEVLANDHGYSVGRRFTGTPLADSHISYDSDYKDSISDHDGSREFHVFSPVICVFN